MDAQKRAQTETSSLWHDFPATNSRRDPQRWKTWYWSKERAWNWRRRTDGVATETVKTYFGHVVCMGPERFSNILLYGHISGNRSRGRPRKRWIDNAREDCELLGLSLVETARVQAGWQRTEGTRILLWAELPACAYGGWTFKKST